MTPTEAATAILTHWKTYWDVAFPAVSYAFDNELFAEPETATPWVRVSVRHSTSIQDTLGAKGSRRFERKAIVYVNIFTPANEGSEEHLELQSAVLELFEGERLGVTSDSPVVRAVNLADLGVDGRWYNVTLEILVDYYASK